MLKNFSSTEITFSVETIQQLQRTLDEASVYMARKVQNEDIVICIGATRAGKSTLINYLIGNELVAERPGKGRPIAIKKTGDQSAGPEIGAGSTSKTTIPTRWISKELGNMAIWDSPGFEDNRGAVQDIMNAFYLYQLLQKVKSLRFVIIIDIHNLLSDNIHPFVSVLNSVEEVLGHIKGTHLSSLSVIFTKVPNIWDDATVDLTFVSEILKEKVLHSSMSLSEASKDIVEFLVNNNKHIGLFKRLDIGKVTPQNGENIFSTIMNSSPLGKDDLKDIHPSISDKAKIYLYKSRNTLLPMGEFNILENVVSSAIHKKVQDLKNNLHVEEKENRTRSHIAQLEEIDSRLFNALTHKSDFSTKIATIESIDTDIRNAINQHNLLEKVHLMQFVDKLLGLEECNLLALNLHGVLLSSSSKVKQALNFAQLKLGEITREKYDELIKEDRKRHHEEMDKLRQEQEESKKRNDEGSSWIEKLFIPIVKGIFQGLNNVSGK